MMLSSVAQHPVHTIVSATDTYREHSGSCSGRVCFYGVHKLLGTICVRVATASGFLPDVVG